MFSPTKGKPYRSQNNSSMIYFYHIVSPNSQLSIYHCSFNHFIYIQHFSNKSNVIQSTLQATYNAQAVKIVLRLS